MPGMWAIFLQQRFLRNIMWGLVQPWRARQTQQVQAWPADARATLGSWAIFLQRRFLQIISWETAHRPRALLLPTQQASRARAHASRARRAALLRLSARLTTTGLALPCRVRRRPRGRLCTQGARACRATTEAWWRQRSHRTTSTRARSCRARRTARPALLPSVFVLRGRTGL